MYLRTGSEGPDEPYATSADPYGRLSYEPAAHSVEFPSLPTVDHTYSHKHHDSQSKDESSFAARRRTKSISEHTQQAVRVMAPPVSFPLVILCMLWYLTSAVSSNLGKAILGIFDYPVSLTMAQFLYALVFASCATVFASRNQSLAALVPRGTVSTTGLVGPSRTIAMCVAPMAGFQIAGHILSHSATSQIPVSLVHAIKALSPLFTVMAYTLLFGIRYNLSTYLSLLPLTIGVIMACSAEFKARPMAILYAVLAAMVFVSQNMWSKGLLTTGMTSAYSQNGNGTENTRPKLDKLTILYWCAAFAFVGTLPIWLSVDGVRIIRRGIVIQGTFTQLFVLYTLNGFSHFCQNLLSFMILGSISPVSYSIASLLKRIVVISVAIVWFGQQVSRTQGWGVVITFVGLYIYDRFGSKRQSTTPPSLPT